MLVQIFVLFGDIWMMIYRTYYTSPIGMLEIKATDSHIVECLFVGDDTVDDVQETTPLLQSCTQQLDEYFAKKRTVFELPVQQAGTPFQQLVWISLQSIPYGETISYKQLAERMGKPDAIRAIATAIGQNRIDIMIPCHRVLGSDGSLTGYNGGLHRKQALLAGESWL